MKTFQEKLRENPESFDYMDARPGPGRYPEADRDEVTPPHVKEMIEARRAKRRKE